MADMMDLDIKNRLYTLIEPLAQKSRDLYEGSPVVKAKGETYLFRTENETDKGYRMRLGRAVYDNWMEVVVGSRLALSWKKPPTREKFGAELEGFFADVDGYETQVDTFFKGIAEAAAVDGLCWVLVDKTMIAEVVVDGVKGAISTEGVFYPFPLSKAAEAALGVRPFFSKVTRERVFDWKVGEDRLLDWAVVQVVEIRQGEPGYAAATRDLRLVWTREKWMIYRQASQEEAAAKQMRWIVDREGVNPLGAVPLVPFYGVKREEYLGNPVTTSILDHAISLYNKFSDRDYAEFMTNNPIPYMIGSMKPDKIDAGHGKGIFVQAAPQVQSSVGYIEPTGKGIEATRTSERDLIRRIVETALRQAKRDSAQVQSDDSLKEEAKVFNSSLVSVAVAAEASETACWKLFQKWLNDGSEFAGKITYNRDFDDKTIETAMIDSMSKVVAQNQAPLRILLELLQRAGIISPDEDVKKLLTEIEDDMTRSGMPGFQGEQNAEDEGALDDENQDEGEQGDGGSGSK